ncbi:hypothetical protein E0J09_03590 [Rhizobium leguminosarum bv. viciae]|uniref:hypothetical protein n=1 Tax=Rhizobium TaxID=379 RepID=UPI00103CC2C5|nr:MULTISPECIES: hypothetical protein [Rhizobium]NKM56361.1 hypothetical protein [Rhizobium anhuiense]TCB30471.1 hypothetical protein E0J09_03590 [Rhizobium leguminosarum bv. viciae]
MIKSQQKQLKRYGPGYSIAAFARASGLPYRRVERAVAAGEINCVELGGVKRIPETELPRVLRAYGIETVPAE